MLSESREFVVWAFLIAMLSIRRDDYFDDEDDFEGGHVCLDGKWMCNGRVHEIEGGPVYRMLDIGETKDHFQSLLFLCAC